MPEARPFDVIADFATWQEASVRRNVATALGVVADERSVALLVDMALNDVERSVREVAETQLAQLNDDGRQHLRRLLVTYAQSNDQTLTLRSSSLVGRLRQRGLRLGESDEVRMARRVDADGVPLSPFGRLRAQLSRLNKVRLMYGMSPRRWVLGTLAGLGMVGIVTLYTRVGYGGSAEEMAGYAGLAAFIALVVLIFSTRRKVPLVVQWDPHAALVRDMLETALCALVVGLAATITWFSTDLPVSEAVVLGFLAGSAAALGLPFVHLGSYLALTTWRGLAFSRLWHFWTALGAGVVAQTVLVLIGRRTADTYYFAITNEAVWMFALPAAAAIAASISILDATPRTASAVGPFTLFRTRSALVVGAVAALLAGTALFRLLPDERETGDILASVDWGQVSGRPEILPSLGIRSGVRLYQFGLPYGQTISVRVSMGFDIPSRQLTLSLVGPPRESAAAATRNGCADIADQSTVVVTSGDTLNELLGAGCYELRLDTTIGGTFNEVLQARSGFASEGAGSAELMDITVNVDGADLLSSPPSRLVQGRPASWIASRSDGPMQTVTLEVREGASFLFESGAAGLLGTTSTDPPENSRLKLTTTGGELLGAGGRVVRRLEPGFYTLEVTPEGDEVASVYAYSMAGLSSEYFDAPAVVPFQVTAAGALDFVTEQSEGEDLVLEVMTRSDFDSGSVNSIGYGDDPPEAMDTYLEPGEYVAVVRRYSGGLRDEPTRLLSGHTLEIRGENVQLIGSGVPAP